MLCLLMRHTIYVLKARQEFPEWCKLENKYLVIACDRHQKLRLTEVDDQERMISGLNFSGCSKLVESTETHSRYMLLVYH